MKTDMSDNKVMDYVPAAPCLKCGSEDIEIKVFVDAYICPPSGGGVCRSCGSKSELGIKHDDDSPREVWYPECVDAWNHYNKLRTNIDYMVGNIEKAIRSVSKFKVLEMLRSKGIKAGLDDLEDEIISEA